MKRILALALLLSSAPLVYSRGGFGEGFGWGAFTGLVGGAIISKAASCNTPPPVYYVEDPYAEQRRMEVQMREEQIRMRELEQRRREREEEIRRQEERARKLRKLNKSTIVENTIVETRTVAHPAKDRQIELRERELALKEQQTQLALVKEQKELLKEQNRKKELQLKEKELELKLSKACTSNHDLGLEKTVTKKFSKRTLSDDDPLSFVS